MGRTRGKLFVAADRCVLYLWTHQGVELLVREFVTAVVMLATVISCGAPTEHGTATIVLTPERFSLASTMRLTAAGSGKHSYMVHRIDTTAFRAGGTLDLEVTIPSDGGMMASFDLLPDRQAFAIEGYPAGSLATAYDIGVGQTKRLSYPFKQGQVFQFGGEGSWSASAGATGSARYTATVRY